MQKEDRGYCRQSGNGKRSREVPVEQNRGGRPQWERRETDRPVLEGLRRQAEEGLAL